MPSPWPNTASTSTSSPRPVTGSSENATPERPAATWCWITTAIGAVSPTYDSAPAEPAHPRQRGPAAPPTAAVPPPESPRGGPGLGRRPPAGPPLERAGGRPPVRLLAPRRAAPRERGPDPLDRGR